jgi:hypothetical protein
MDSALRVARRAIAAVALMGVAPLAACGSASTSGANSPAAPSGSAATTPAPSAAPATPLTPTGPGPCPTSSLQVKPGVSQGTAGSVYVALVFTNISNVTCTLYGYPGVSLATGKPVTQIGQAAVENPATPRQLVTLQPGAAGNALLQIVDAGNYPPSRCHPVTAHFLQIYPPNQTTPVYVAYKTQGCAKPVHLLTINAMRPGAGSGG